VRVSANSLDKGLTRDASNGSALTLNRNSSTGKMPIEVTKGDIKKFYTDLIVDGGDGMDRKN